MTEGFAARACALLAGALLSCSASAATLTLGVLQRADDGRLAPQRTALTYPGQPGGPAREAVELALQESAFELDAAALRVVLEVREAHSAAEAASHLRALEKAGAAGAVIDLPAAWIAEAAAATAMPLVNAGDSAEAPRQLCRANLFHTLPGERMRADALAQALLARRWTRVLLLAGPSTDDAARLALAQAAIKRYGLKVSAVKAFKLSADPRERDLANPLLLTAGNSYDAVWVVDSDGEFARTLPYRTVLPRPVVGDGGLVALAWHAQFERYGAPQVSRRFAKAAKRPMTSQDWAAWMAGKALAAAAISAPKGPNAAWASALAKGTLDGSKGTNLSFRAWDGQLRQPMLLSDGQGVIAQAPAEGMLHPRDVLDTLGADAPEKLCPTAR